MWLVIWVMAYVLQFFFTQLIPGFKGKYGMPVVFVVVAICLVGIAVAAWTYFLMPALERKHQGEKNVVPSREL
jgi:peptidoglycan/LPS O-acetylase OafA/YrhL